jgi:hypothetical protein
MEISLENEVNIEIMHTVREDMPFLAFLYFTQALSKNFKKGKGKKIQ